MDNVTSKSIIFSGYLNIVEYLVNNRFKRNLYAKTDINGDVCDYVVTGLVVNKKAGLAFFVKQSRPALYHLNDNTIIEAVAGNVDKGEDTTDAFIREVEEELNITLIKSEVSYIGDKYSSPGRMAEVCSFFIAHTENMPSSNRGGLAEENEDIEIITIGLDELRSFQSQDLKTQYLIEFYNRYVTTEY